MSDIASLGIKVTTDGVQQAADNLDKMANAGDRAAASAAKVSKPTAEAARAFQAEADSLAALIGKMDPVSRKLDDIAAAQLRLNALRKAGGISDFGAADLQSQLDRAKAAIEKTGDAVHSFSINNANARRELGLLAKDLATGNWGRFQQSFATLAGQSGALGLAFSAAGATVAAIVAPLALFAAGAIKGYTENEKLRTSLIATNDAAGVSAAGLDKMASQVGAATGHWGDARKAIDDFVASGKVAGAGISGLAKEAVDMSTVTGESIDKTVAKLIELGEKPAETIAKLNEQYHVLTNAQYARIAALEEEGRVSDAARLANEALADEMSKRAKEVEDNAGWIVRSAHWVRDAWNEAWDTVKQVGKPTSLADQVREVQGQIEALLKPGPKVDRQGNLVQGNQAGASDSDPRVIALRQQLADLRKQQFDEGLAGVNKSVEDQANAQGIAAQLRLAKYMSPKDRLDDSIKKANEDRLAALYGVVDPDERNRIEQQAKTQIAEAQATYRAAIKREAGPDDSIDAEVLARKNLQDAIKKEIELDKQQLEQWARNTTAVANYRQAMEDKLKTDQAAINLQVASVSMGQQELALQRQLIQIEKDADNQRLQLERDRANKAYGMDDDEYQGRLRLISDFERKRKQQVIDGNADLLAAQGDWENGMVGAIKNFEESAANVASSTKSMFTNAFEGIGDAIANFVTTGKLNFADLASSIVSDLVKIETRILVSQALQSIFGSFTPGTDALALSGINSQISSNTSAIKWNANGGVYDSPSLSDYSGQVVDRPTMFAFAKGAGVMGEAGPEAILPLTLGSNGKLGVQSAGGGTQVEVNITNNGQPVQAQQTGTRQDGSKVIIDMVLTAVAQDVSRGGKVAKAHEQRYGIRQRGVSVAGA